jgi:plasmid maintenance system antidote protein VapI
MFNPAHPGEILKSTYLEPLNLSVSKADKKS